LAGPVRVQGATRFLFASPTLDLGFAEKGRFQERIPGKSCQRGHLTGNREVFDHAQDEISSTQGPEGVQEKIRVRLTGGADYEKLAQIKKQRDDRVRAKLGS